MCGRYTLTADLSVLQARFEIEDVNARYVPRYNVAPAQEVLVVTSDGNQRCASMMRWGLVPSWAKDISIGKGMINARAETVVDNKVFGQVFPGQRCLVIADSFYEWRRSGATRVPMRVVLKSRELFAFAGLWSTWKPRHGHDRESFYSCAIITTVPNALVEPIHNRMPVIVAPDEEQLWLNPVLNDTAQLRELLLPYPASEMEAYEVSPLVNSSRNESPVCIKPI